MKTLAKKSIYIFFGTIFLIIGVIGIFLPLLPTTPFLLLTAFFYSRSSQKFHNWLLNHKWFGPPVNDWYERGAIRPRIKLLSTSMIIAMSPFVLMRESIPVWAKLSYVITMIGVIIFLWTRPNS